MTKFQLYCSCIICKLSTTTQNLNRHNITHSRTSTICPECNSTTKNNKFCSKSCAAIYNNRHRSADVSTKQKASYKLKNSNKTTLPKKERIKRYRTCVNCGKIDSTTIGHFQSDKCMYCNDSLTYRELCRFTFNIKNFPNEFDLALLKSGMFHPVTNKGGVSKDHMLSISYGKKNKVDPKIMSHPANCKLMTQIENKAKQHHSSISYEELLIRIKTWDMKYNDAGTGNAPISDQAYETCRVT